MSTTTERAVLPQQRIPEPPPAGSDRSKWRSVGRGSGVPQAPPLVGVEVHFDREQSDWLTADRERTGLEYGALLKKLVDEARGRNAT